MLHLTQFIIVLLVGSMFATFSTEVQLKTCEGIPDTWFDAGPFTKVGTKYYFIEGNVWVSWFEALHACRRHNAQLATIDNEPQMTSLQAYLIAQGYKDNNLFWVGANDLAQESIFHWVGTGQRVSYMKWSKHQPDNDENNEHCVQLTKDTESGQFLMNDAPCANHANYLCLANDPRTFSFTVW